MIDSHACLQLYRINVLLQAPEGLEASKQLGPPFFVLRRYNQFRQLYEKVLQTVVVLTHDYAQLPGYPPWQHLPPHHPSCLPLSLPLLQLKAQFPEAMRERGLAPPPKHALHLGTSKVGAGGKQNWLAAFSAACTHGMSCDGGGWKAKRAGYMSECAASWSLGHHCMAPQPSLSAQACSAHCNITGT